MHRSWTRSCRGLHAAGSPQGPPTKRRDADGERIGAPIGIARPCVGAELLIQTLDQLSMIIPTPQNDAESSCAPILKKEDGHIDWTRPAQEIHNRVRGFQPWPGGYGFLRGVRFNIWKSLVADLSLA